MFPVFLPVEELISVLTGKGGGDAFEGNQPRKENPSRIKMRLEPVQFTIMTQ